MNKQYFVKMGIISFVLLAGCAYHEYEIEVNPQGKEFERKLTVRRWEYGSTDSSSDSKRYLKKLSDDEIQRLVQLYETRLTGDDSKEQSFVGRFKSRTPSDVGGSGSYIHLASPIGALGGYVEKFRGDDDLAAQLHKIQAASDRLANLITAWFEAELQDDPRWDTLRQFCEQEFRQDLENLGMYFWRANISDGSEDHAFVECASRFGQYLVDRDYFTPEEFPFIVTVVARIGRDDRAEALMTYIQRMVAKRMGVGRDEALPDSLSFLSSSRHMRESFAAFARTTPEYRKLIEEWEQKKKTSPDLEQPKEQEIITAILDDLLAFELDFLEDQDRVKMSLNCKVEPLYTNGQWNQDEKRIVWSSSIKNDKVLPTFFFAFWAVPSETFQTEHFGRVLLSGSQLAEYHFWYAGLSDTEKSEWDSFLIGLKPADSLKKKIESFLFTGEDLVGDEKSLAHSAQQLLLDALEIITAPQPLAP